MTSKTHYYYRVTSSSQDGVEYLTGRGGCPPVVGLGTQVVREKEKLNMKDTHMFPI